MRIRLRESSLARNRHVAAISATQLIRILGRSQAWIFIPVYLADVRHVQYVVIGLLFFGTAMVSLPFSIYGGSLIDRLGRRFAAIYLPPVIMLLMLALALLVYLHSPLYEIYASFLLVEPFTSVQGILDNVVVTDTTQEAERTSAFSAVRIAGNIGFSMGPAIGGFISQAGYFYVFLVPAVLTGLEWVLYIRYITETSPGNNTGGKKFRFPWSDRKFIVLSLLVASMWFVAGQWGTTLTLFWTNVDRIPNSLIGVLYSVNGLVVVFMQVPTNWMLARMRDFNRIALGGAVYAVSFLMLAFSSSFIFLIVDVVIITMGENIISPVAYSLIGKVSPPDRRGEYFGSFQLMMGLVTPFAPVIGTALLEHFSHAPLLMWLPIFTAGIILSAMVSRVGKSLMASRRPRGEITRIS